MGDSWEISWAFRQEFRGRFRREFSWEFSWGLSCEFSWELCREFRRELRGSFVGVSWEFRRDFNVGVWISGREFGSFAVPTLFSDSASMNPNPLLRDWNP